MELIGSYQASGYIIEAYFPESGSSDAWTIWVIRDGNVVGEFIDRIAVESVYGMDATAMTSIERAAEAALREVLRRDAQMTHDAFAEAA